MSNTTNAPGRVLLKVTGILYIISGIFSLIGGIIIVAGGGFLGLGAEEILPGAGAVIAGGIIVSGIIVMLVAIWRIVVGVLGAKHCANPEKAKMLRVLILIALAVNVISVVITSFTAGIPWWDLAFLILPVLFFLGAQKNINA